MDEIVELGLSLVDKYQHAGIFRKSCRIPNNIFGSADYLALVAYPSIRSDEKRSNFKDAMLSALLKESCKTRGIRKADKTMLAQRLGLSKDMIWRDIDRAITGGTKKDGGGTKKLIDRFHSYHVFRAYDSALSDDANLTFEQVLGEISTAYESQQSKVSDSETRIENLKRTFRQSRPVLHLTWGLVESFKLKGWATDTGQLCYGVKPAIHDPSWLPEALDLAKIVLGLQLVEYESAKLNGKRLRSHKFDPQEIIYIHF
ncbi:hypothetical protein Shal_0323 [Shewanella halifaxensis HAW-EB4]|uniref:Uncharacterized protein n=1 Tax=Shewanella halifaxensis (strain HAW-EB4) TaxID=458817 RepID=B0TPM8_SHEHH|nr:hypothetical protein [Shewanella halifaxensis]ABZ74899.1 hypothetical protein Shal_0323 [Shewanella halifaxensis HAW-EB4]